MKWKPGRTTPWGMPQTEVPLGHGIYSITTGGHGGLFLPDDVRDELPQEVANSLFLSRGSGDGKRTNWAEEDCDLAVVIPFLWEKVDKSQLVKEFGERAGDIAFWLEHAKRTSEFFPEEYGSVGPLLVRFK